ILTAACHIARRGGRTSVGEQDLWRAMLANRQQTIVQLLQHLGHVALANDDAEDRAPDAHDALGGASSLADPLVMASDLSQRRRDGKLSPIIGRTSELGCLLRKLSAGADAHPVLIVGHRGVGKTALVEGLA